MKTMITRNNYFQITKSELEDKNRLVFNLQLQVDETKTESEYQVSQSLADIYSFEVTASIFFTFSS